MSIATNPDAIHHTQKLKGQLCELIDHLRFDEDSGMEPRARLLFETSADVLAGLVKAFEDYESSAEDAESSSWSLLAPSCRDSEL